jgi:hypothetical protein
MAARPRLEMIEDVAVADCDDNGDYFEMSEDVAVEDHYCSLYKATVQICVIL